MFSHEMGHNFASVGEEYDGGTAYYGAKECDGGNVKNMSTNPVSES